MLADLLAQEHSEDEPVDLDQAQAADPMIARRLLIELAIVDRARSRTRATLEAVRASYEERLRAHAERERLVRGWLANYVAANGSVGFPDAGSCHLTQRNPQLVVTDTAAFEAWALHEQHTKIVVDLTAARKHAESLFAAEGELVTGCEISDPPPSLVVRRPPR